MYRAATLAGILTNSTFGFIRAAVLVAVVKGRPGVGGFDPASVVTFSFLTQGLLAIMSAFGDDEISLRIRSGDVVTDLYRPVDFQAWWFAADVGRAAFQLIARSVPIAIIGALTYGLVTPAGVDQWVLFGMSLALGLSVSFALRFITNLTTFWLLDNRGTSQLVVVLTLFFSGVFMPVSFFPAGLLSLARHLPFACLLQFPADIFLNRATGGAALNLLVAQAAWAIGLLGLGRFMLGAAERKVVIQGG